MGADAEVRERLEAFLRARLPTEVSVRDLARVPGGASRETWTFTLRDPEGAQRLVLRRDPPGVPASTDRATEAEVLRAAEAAGVPVPRVLWVGGADELGAPGFVMGFVDGETIPRRILRDDAYEQARSRLAARCGEALARIHGIETAELPGLEPAGPVASLEVVERYREVLRSFREPHPALELGARWLEQRAPAPDRVTLVHGDFRLGNLVVGPDDLRAVLDWELAHLGDPWEDLGWLVCRTWRFGGPGEVGGFGDRSELYRAYEEASGVAVDEEAVAWWEILSSFKWGVMCLVQAFTHLDGHVRSLELAAIGRRTCEPAYDLLRLIG